MTGTAPRGRGRRSVKLATTAPIVAAVVAVIVAAVSTSAVIVPGTSAAAARSPMTRPHGAGAVTSAHLIVAAATDPATGGYWLTASDGGVFSFGAPFEGSAGALPLRSPVVGMAPTADGQGYRLVAGDGGVFAYGDAGYYGSMGGLPLNRPMVAMASTPDGTGYWTVASDGGIFAYGTAPFLGSMGGLPLNRPIVGMAATADGKGYWLVASDGGIFAFGDAPFVGSAGALPLASPVVDMAPGGASGGYRLVAADGGIFCFGAPFAGSSVGLLKRAAVAVGSAGGGYRVVSADGSVQAFGGASFLGSVSVPPLVGEVVTIDPGHDGGNGSDPGFINQPIDGGGLIESCDTAGTSDPTGYTEHAFNFDVAVRLASLIESGGGTAVLTRYSDTGVGPCVDTRAAIANLAGSDAAVSIHGDGGPVGGRGFAVDVPLPVVSPTSDNRAIVAPSGALGAAIRDGFLAATGAPVSDYTGADGIVSRSDLGGLNLSTVPKVLIECGNMQNPGDAALMEDAAWRQQAAQGLADGITAFLVQSEVP